MRQTPFAQRHPYLFVAALEVAIVLAYLAAGTVAHFTGLSDLGLYGLANVALTAIAAALLTSMGWWGTTGLRRAGRVQDLPYYAVPLVPMFLNLIPGLAVSGPGQLLQVLGLTLMVGFSEEAFFRGLMLRALLPRGAWRAVLVTAALFGLTHALNTLAGKSGPDVAAQVLYAMAIGFGYAAVALRTGALWPLVVIHFLADFAGLLQRPGFALSPTLEMGMVLGTTALFVAYGLWLMLTRPAIEPAGAGDVRTGAS